MKMRLGSGSSKNARQKSRTPSTEILSDEYSRAEPRTETQTISPKSTSMLTKNWKKQPWKSHIQKEVKVREQKDDQESEEQSNSEYEEADDQDNKVPKNKKNQRQ